MNKLFVAGGALLLSGVVFGCVPKVALHTEKESATIRGAEEIGANDVPVAKLYLQFAKEELAAANNLQQGGDKVAAESMLLRAQADAELALVLARHSDEKAEADAAIERVRVLRRENP